MTEIDLTYLSLYTLLAIYVAGFLVSLTPCVYPLIPIVIGYLGNQAGSNRHRILAALSYVSGLSLVYAALGVIAALTGKMFGDMTVNLYVYFGFGLLLLVMGGSMMDWYLIPLPQFLQPKVSPAGTKISLKASFLVGASSGLVASPCTAPVMISILFHIASERNILRGAILMLVFSLGMNTLFLFLGLSVNFLRALPRSGIWIVVIKKLMAFLILGSGLYFIFQAGRL
jgi:thiol:disulfide interchange protein DsbD